jgi:hypothetical protein
MTCGRRIKVLAIALMLEADGVSLQGYSTTWTDAGDRLATNLVLL